jgi:ABC-type multidrug transport system fused ATPase/permease subunit
MHQVLKDKLFYKFFKENKRYFVYYILIITLIKPIKSILIPKQYSKLFDSAKGGDKNFGIIQTTIFFLIGIWIVSIVLEYFKNMIDAELLPKFLSNARNVIFKDTVHLHSEKYQDVKTGEFITRVYDLTRMLRDIMIYVLEFFYPTIVVTLSVVGYYLVISKKMALIVLLSISILVGFSIYYGGKSIRLSAEREHYYLQMTEKMNDSLGNLMNVYLNNQDESEIKKNKEIEGEHTRLYVEQNKNTEKLVFTMSIIVVATLFLVIWQSYRDLKNKKISSESFTTILLVFIYYVDYMFGISWEIPHFLNKLGIVKNSIPFLENILLHKQRESDGADVADWSIECRNVSFRYRNDLPFIYHQLNLKINDKEKVGFMGKSGMGKSTLAKLILGIYQPTEGEILIGGKPQTQQSNHFLRKHINYINQKTNLFNETVLFNLQYGNNVDRDTILKKLKHYDLLSIYDRLEKGIDNISGVQGGNLSLGMQKITVLMRGILKGGNIIILDEPLTSLDHQTRGKVMRMIQEECRDKTVIIITHDKEVIPYVDRVIHMEDLSAISTAETSESRSEIDPESWIYGES